MEPLQDVAVVEALPADQPAPERESVVNQLRRYWNVMAIALFGLFVALSPNGSASAQINIDADVITQGFFDGANIVLGMAGLLALMALPYGIQFAFGFVQGIFGRFANIRF